MAHMYMQKQKSKSKVVKKQETVEELKAKQVETDAMLADIDAALEGIDQALAENYVQQGGE